MGDRSPSSRRSTTRVVNTRATDTKAAKTRAADTKAAKTRAADTKAAETRAMSPMLAKALEAGIVVVFIGVLTASLYAGAVPDYRSATGQDVGDRTLVAVGNEIEQSVPPNATQVHVESRLNLPTTIRSAPYRIVASNENGTYADSATTGVSKTNTTPGMGTENTTPDETETADSAPRLILDHPHGAIKESHTLALPSHVTAVRGAVSGGHGRIIISQSTDQDGLVVTLEDRA